MAEKIKAFALKIFLIISITTIMSQNRAIAYSGDVISLFKEMSIISYDVHINYREDWAKEGYWLLPEFYDKPSWYVEEGIGGSNPGGTDIVNFLPPTTVVIYKIIHTIIRITLELKSGVEFGIKSVLNKIENAVYEFVNDFLKETIKKPVESFGKLIKEIVPPLYQPHLITNFTIFGFDPLALGKSLLSGLLQIIWVASLLHIILDIMSGLKARGGQEIIFNHALQRLLVWGISIVLSSQGYVIITQIYALAGDVINALCTAGTSSCSISTTLAQTFYGEGANATSFLIGLLVIVGGAILLIAGAIFFVIRAILAFVMVFVAPLMIGLANLPLLSSITEIWMRMTGAFVGANLVYGLLSMTLTLLYSNILSGTEDWTVLLRMLTGVCFGALSAAWMLFALKKSIIVLKFVAKAELLRLARSQLSQFV